MVRSVKSSSLLPASNFNPSWNGMQPDYSPLMKLGFRTLKGFFLFITGFCIAYLFSASLNATAVVARLHELAMLGFMPMIAFTFSVMAIVAVLESFR